MASKTFSSLSEKNDFEKRKAQEINAWVLARLDGPIEIANLVDASGLTQFELIRIFAIYFKTTPMQWIRQQKELLSQGKQPQSLIDDLQQECSPAPYIPENLRKK